MVEGLTQPPHMRISNFSWILVSLQFILLLYIVAEGGLYPTSWTWMLLYIAGWIVAFAAVFAFRRSTLSVFPEPHRKAVLLTKGIFGYIRHPFYTAVLSISGSLAGQQGHPFKILAWCLLLVILLVKTSYEEKLLLQQFEQYSTYQLHTKKFIPFLY